MEENLPVGCSTRSTEKSGALQVGELDERPQNVQAKRVSEVFEVVS
jgi:hypothetical protein